MLIYLLFENKKIKSEMVIKRGFLYSNHGSIFETLNENNIYITWI